MSVRSTSSAVSYDVSDVQVMGVHVDCPYTSFSDEEGNFEIGVLDLTGKAPKSFSLGPRHSKRIFLTK